MKNKNVKAKWDVLTFDFVQLWRKEHPDDQRSDAQLVELFLASLARSGVIIKDDAGGYELPDIDLNSINLEDWIGKSSLVL